MAVYQQLIATDFNFGTVTENLENTLFKTTYRVPDPFLLNIESSGINCNYQFGSVTDITIPYSGDLLNKIALHAILPKLKARYNIQNINDIFDFLKTYGIDLDKTKYYTNVNDVKFTNNKNAYDKIILLINEWIRDTKEINNKINNIFKEKFSVNSIIRLINDDPWYETYVSFKTCVNNTDFSTSVVSNEWIRRTILKTLMNECSNLVENQQNNLVDKQNVIEHTFKKDFELLFNININNTLSDTINNIMNALTIDTNNDTVLFKYLYEYQSNLTNTTTYSDFFKYIKTQIQGQYGTQEHWKNGAILCYQHSKTCKIVTPVCLFENNNICNKRFSNVGTLITNVQQNILDNVSILLDRMIELDQIDTKDTLKILDMVAISRDYLGFEDITITCYNLNMMSIVTLIRLKEKLLERCVESYYEIKMIVSSAMDRIIKVMCKRLQNLLPFLLENQYTLLLDGKLHIVLKEKLITHEMLFAALSSELKELSRYNGITSVLEIAREYLLSTEVSTLICQINAYIDVYEKSTLGLDTDDLKTKVLRELEVVERFVMSGFNNNCLKTWEIDTSTYDNFVNSMFISIKESNLLDGVMDIETINNIRDNLLLEGYWNIEEYLKHVNVNNTIKLYELEEYIGDIIKQHPIHTVILADTISTNLLDKMTNGYLYKAAKSHNTILLETSIKQNKKALKNISKFNILEILQDMYIGKRTKLFYIPLVGIKMIKKVDLYIGSQILCSDYGERMLMAHELDDPLKNRDNYKRLTSENPLYVPLDLWFTRNYESALPLCNLSNQLVMLRVTLKNLDKLVQYPLVGTSCLSKYTELENNLSFPGSILANYIILPDKNRNDLMSNVGYNVIELIQKMGPNYINYNENDDNDNFSFQYHPRRMVKTLFISATLSLNNNLFDNKADDVIKSIKISLDGNERESKKPFAYYSQIQPYERFTSSLNNNNQAVYTFSLNPSDPQPQGCLDMSNVPSLIITFGIDRKKLCIVKQIKINVYSSYYELLRFCKKTDFC